VRRQSESPIASAIFSQSTKMKFYENLEIDRLRASVSRALELIAKLLVRKQICERLTRALLSRIACAIRTTRHCVHKGDQRLPGHAMFLCMNLVVRIFTCELWEAVKTTASILRSTIPTPCLGVHKKSAFEIAALTGTSE
jgi:hypothetical protein